MQPVARHGHGTAAIAPRPARPEAPSHAWVATVARGMAQARSDGPMLNGLVRNITN